MAAGTYPVKKSHSAMAHQIGEAVNAFERRTGSHLPKSMTVVLSDRTLVITLSGALSPIEHSLAQSSNGADQLQKFHQDLFADHRGSLRQEIKRITGVAVCDAITEVEPVGAVVKVSTSGTVVHVVLLEDSVPADTWSGNGPNNESGK